MFTWVYLAEAAAQDGDGSPPGIECTFMSRRIDATGEPADDRDSGLGQRIGQPLGLFQPIRGRMPRAHHGNGHLILRQDLSTHE